MRPSLKNGNCAKVRYTRAMFGGATLVFTLTLAACSVNETSIESEQSVTLGPSATHSNVTDTAAGTRPAISCYSNRHWPLATCLQLGSCPGPRPRKRETSWLVLLDPIMGIATATASSAARTREGSFPVFEARMPWLNLKTVIASCATSLAEAGLTHSSAGLFSMQRSKRGRRRSTPFRTCQAIRNVS